MTGRRKWSKTDEGVVNLYRNEAEDRSRVGFLCRQNGTCKVLHDSGGGVVAGRPRTPTKVLELRGAFKNHPKRRKERELEPEVTGALGDPPECLDEAEQGRWREIADAAPWLTVADRGVVEQTCRLWMMERHGKANAGQSRLLASNWGRLGMTPSDRSKVKVPPAPKKKNAFGELRA